MTKTATIDNTAENTDATPGIGDNGAPRYTLKKLLTAAGKYGEASAKGDAALPSLALEVASAAYEGVLNIAGAGDDIEEIFKAYMAKRTKQSEVGSLTQQVSKLRSIAKVSRFWGYDADSNAITVADMLADANDAHIKAYNDANLRGQMVKGSRYDFLLKVAREQLKLIPDNTPLTADVPVLTPEQINEIMFPAEADPKTVADKAWKLLKDAESLKKGKKNKDGDYDMPPVNEPEMDDTIEAIKNLLWKLDPVGMEKAAEKEKKQEELQQLAAAFGLKVVRAGKRAA